MAPIDRVVLVKAGVPVSLTRQLAQDLGVPKTKLRKWLSLSSRPPARRARRACIEAELTASVAVAAAMLSKKTYKHVGLIGRKSN
jgi:hypothetical protein